MPPRAAGLRRRASLSGCWRCCAGCAVGPTFTNPQATVPAELARDAAIPQIATQTAADSLWWKAFNDPALDRLVELAYRQNLPLQIAGLRIVRRAPSWASPPGRQFPAVQVASGSATAVGLTEHAANVADFDRNFCDYQLGFDAVWELDFWGKYRRGVEAETASLLASVADYYSALVSLTAEVARTYVVIRTFEVLIEQAQENARLQEEGLRIAESRFRNGATSELDVTQATTLLESTRASIPQLQIGLQQARNALSTLLGQPTGTVDALLAGPKEIPKAPAKVAVGVPAEMLRRRPDIRSAELLAAAQCARIGVAKAELYPSFSLFGTIGLAGEHAAGRRPRNLFSADSLVLLRRPADQLAVLQLRPHQERRARRGRAVSAAARRLPRHRAQGGPGGGGRADRLPQRPGSRGVRAERRRRPPQRSVELALVQYREGAVDYQRVLDAQRSLLQQQNSLAQTRSSVATNLIALYKALGGGWELRQGQPVVPEAARRSEMKERTDWGDMLSRAARAGDQAKPATGESTRESAMAKKISKRTLKWIVAVGRRRGRRVHRLPVLEGEAVRAAGGDRLGQRPASRRSSSTSPPRSRCGSRRSSSTKAPSSSRVRCWCSWTPSRSRRSWPRPRRASRPRRRRWRSPRPPSSSRRARSSSPRSRPSAPRSWSRRAPARSASWTSATTKLETTKATLAEAEAMLQDRQAAGRGRAGQRGDDPDAHRRRDAQVARHRTSPLSPGRARRGARRRAARR